MLKQTVAKMSIPLAKVEDQYAKDKLLKREDVLKLLEWANLQLHLPKLTELEVLIFLHSCNYSNEAAKVCIDNYYTCKRLAPEFFTKWDPIHPQIELCKRVMRAIPMPKLTPEGYCVFYYNLMDSNTDHFHLSEQFRYFCMMMDHTLRTRGISNGHVILANMAAFTLPHLLKLNVITLKKYFWFLQEALPVRLKGIHLISSTSFLDKFLAIIKPMMKAELLEVLLKLTVHQSNSDTIFNLIPKDCMPDELGGTCQMSEIQDEFLKNFDGASEFFAEEELKVVDESKRLGKSRNEGEMFGYEGTFKKLQID